MAVLWFDGADYYTSATPWPYALIGNTPGFGSTFARTGAGGLNASFGANWGNAIVPYAASGSWGMGMAARPSSPLAGSSAATSMMGLYANGTEQVSLYLDNLGRLFLGRGVVAGSSGVTPASYGVVNQFHYYEMFASISAAGAISAQAYCDGTLVQTSTLNGVAGGVNAFYFGNKQTSSQFAGPQFAVDDMYVIDGSGPAPWNAPLGDSFVVAEMPSASGSFAQWTPNPAGANLNWNRVSEIPPDGITTYNQAAATGSRDSFIYPNFPPVGVNLPSIYQIMAVMELEYGETDSAGSASVRLIPRQAGTDFVGATPISLGVGFAYGFSVFQKDVNGNLWLPSTLNAPTEFGYERIT
jgi:hypothetical protein